MQTVAGFIQKGLASNSCSSYRELQKQLGLLCSLGMVLGRAFGGELGVDKGNTQCQLSSSRGVPTLRGREGS